jgi:hypothetical protein
LHPKIAADLEHMTVERLERELHPAEELVQGLAIGGKAPLDEILMRLGGAILGAPELGDLFQTSLQADSRALAVFGNEFVL